MRQPSQLSRDLSVFDVTMIGVGAMIGAGIFVLTGEAAGVAGPALILAASSSAPAAAAGSGGRRWERRRGASPAPRAVRWSSCVRRSPA